MPLRRPALIIVSVVYSGALYGASLRAGLFDVRSPYWVLSVGGLLLLSPLYHGLLLPVTAGALQGGTTDWRAAWRRVTESYSRLFLGEIVVGAAVVAGGVLFVLPGILIGMRVIYYKQLIVLDRRTLAAALQESLARTRDWRVLLILFACLGLLYGAALGLDILLSNMTSGAAVHAAAIVVTGILLASMNALVTTLFVSGRADAPPAPAD